ncbi:MAG TPA: multiheme c-type cytochrome [Deferrisomatales bacterium]|nr:multiheme c-type cytochrome [Deferrisomatales bacterium]
MRCAGWVALALLLVPAGSGADYGRPENQTVYRYLGVKWCVTCHSRASDNPRLSLYHSWEDSAHARAWDDLPDGDKDNPLCLRCHTTGYGMARRPDVPDAELRGVQCEACHGPGSHYFTWRVMKDRDRATANGLWRPTREVCVKCHR